jgi:ribosomal protein L32
MNNIKNWEKEYSLHHTQECPHCGGEKLEHTCQHCYEKIAKEVCWEYDGLCEKCFDYIHKEIPRIEALKQELGVKCQCNNPACGKCLSICCKDDNCPVHTKELKEGWLLKSNRKIVKNRP